MPKLPTDQARVLRALYEWLFIGHGPSISQNRMESVPHYILAAELDGSGVDALACLDVLAAKGLVHCIGQGDEGGKWTLPGGRVLRVTLGQTSAGPTLCCSAHVYVQDPGGPWRLIVGKAGREACGKLFALTSAGIEAVEEYADSPAVRLSQGMAHIRAIEKNPNAQEAMQRAQARLRALAEAMRDPELEHERALREQDQAWKALADAIQESLRAAQQDLGELGFQPPKTLEDWEHLARVVEMPLETIRAGLFTAREVYLMALAWVDRLRVKSRLANGDNNSPQKSTHSPDFTSVDWFGTRHTFTKGNQAQSVKALWEEWESGEHSLTQETIADRIGTAAQRFRLADVFRKRRPNGGYVRHPAWGKMIQSDSKGTYRLARPK